MRHPSRPVKISVSQTLFAGLLTLTTILAAHAETVLPQATASARLEQRQQQVRQVRPDNYDLSRHPVTDAKAAHWRNLLWTTAIVEPQEPFVAEAIAQMVSLTSQPQLSTAQQATVDMAMQVATQLYLSNPAVYASVGAQFGQTIDRSQNSEWVAMALAALVRVGLSPEQRHQLTARIQQRFPQWADDVYLYTTLRDVAERDSPPPLPPLTDLLNWSIAPGQLQMMVFCQSDRGELCHAVLKDRNGRFVRQNGQLWSVPLLLRSIHELEWVFTRGETPQGIYRIEGTRAPDLASVRAYGSFSLVKLFVPMEVGVQEFVPGQGSTWSGGLAAYQALLPPSWRGYFAMQQSYWAGRVGRGLFRIHGSGETPSFFTNNNRYPDSAAWNPTLGCLSAIELYDDAGRLQQADMPKILEALRAIGGQNFTGYLVVVETPGMSQEQLEATIADLP